jgi:predicted PurR-regulated permease PerM
MDNTQRFYLIVASFFLIGLLIYALQPVLIPFFIGGLLAYLGDPVADWFEAKGLNRIQAATIVFLLLALFVFGMLFVTVPLLVNQLDVLSGKLPVIIEWLRTVVGPWLKVRLNLPELLLPATDMQSALADHWGSVSRAVAKIWMQIGSSSVSFIAWLAQLALIPVVTFYLLRDWDILVTKVRQLIPVVWLPTADNLAIECNEVLGAFFRGQMLVMLALGTIYSLGLWLLDLELSMLVGFVAGLASIVPYMGFLVGIIAASAAAFAQFGEASILLWVLLVFGVGQAIEGMLLTPMLVGGRIGLHPVAVIFSVLAGGQLAGFVGVLIALPVSAVIMVFLRHIHGSYKLSNWYTNLGAKVVASPEVDKSEFDD